MANDKTFKIKNGLSAGRYLGTNGTETAGSNGPYGAFSTDLYTGNNSTQTITNNVDLATDGGAVWIKRRDGVGSHAIFDTVRGRAYNIQPSGTDPQDTFSSTTGLTSFNSDGFSLGTNNYGSTNQNGATYVSWTFKQASSFFDVVTYTGDGTTDGSKTISHSLGTTVGSIFIKGLSNTFDWRVWHRNDGSSPQILFLNQSYNAQNDGTVLNVTDTNFSVAHNAANQSGVEYVAYLFAHDTSADGYIQCGSYTGNGSTTGPEIDLGWQPSWIMIKNATASGANWVVEDTQRGIVTGGNDGRLFPNTSDAENYNDPMLRLTSTGFAPESTSSTVNTSGETYIYVAIRGVVSTQTLDLSTGHTFSITPTEALDVLFSNPPASGVATGFTVEVDNSAGGYAITWPSSIKWHLNTAPTATASKEVYTFITTDGGTTYYGKKAGESLA